MPQTREEQLVDIARRARRWFKNRVEGTGLNGSMNDDVLIGRELTRVLDLYADIEPVSDLDRRELAESRR